MKKLIKFVFWILWIIMLFLFHIVIYTGIDESDSSFVTFGIVSIVFWWGLTLGISKIKSKVKENKETIYKKQYVSNIEINDERFGKIIIEHDSYRHLYDAEIKNVNFDGKVLDASIYSDDNVNIEKIIDNLKYFCDNAISIKNRIFKEFTDYLQGNDNTDEEGNLIKITEDYLRDNFKFSSITLSDEESIQMLGSWEGSGSQDYSITYNINKDEFEYELL